MDWWSDFAAWCYKYLPLGSWADWFAAIGTVGALLLGVLLLARDREQTRRTGADGFVTWHRIILGRQSKDDTYWKVEITAYNAGDRPIPQATIVPKPGHRVGFPALALALEPIAPGQTVKQVVGFEEDIPRPIPLWLTYTDAHNVRWIRDLGTNKYIKPRTIRRLYRKYKNDRLLSLNILFPHRPRSVPPREQRRAPEPPEARQDPSLRRRR